MESRPTEFPDSGPRFLRLAVTALRPGRERGRCFQVNNKGVWKAIIAASPNPFSILTNEGVAQHFSLFTP
jgi:hypothetical protein